MDRRRLLFTGLAGVLAAAFAAAPAAEALTPTALPAQPLPEAPRAEAARNEPLQAEPVQYRAPPPGHRRHRRCWTEQRRVAFRDRHGRIRHRVVSRRVCR